MAALNHPNICTLFDVGTNYLVMELVEGESPQGPMPLDTAMNYARQIAAALEEAHEKGVVHRDLKPGNIKIRPDGTVKVLDFGLAKIGGTPTAQSENSPTISMAATQAGMSGFCRSIEPSRNQDARRVRCLTQRYRLHFGLQLDANERLSEPLVFVSL